MTLEFPVSSDVKAAGIQAVKGCVTDGSLKGGRCQKGAVCPHALTIRA